MQTAIRTAAAAMALTAILAARAETVTYSATGTNPASGAIAAQAILTLAGGQLTIDLKNTGPAARVPSDVLNALMFTIAPGATLSPVSATLMDGSTYTNTPGAALGQEWQYRAGISGPAGTNAGISSAGLGLFSAGNFAPGGNNLQGMDYGLVNGIATDANKPTREGIFVNNGARFVLDAPNLALCDISNVQFQYGTALADPTVPGTPNTPDTPPVPEPGAMSLLAVGALGSLSMLRRRK